MIDVNIRCYELAEIRYPVSIVCARLEFEDGTQQVVRPFKYRPITMTYDNEGIEHMAKAGKEDYRLRFSVKSPGRAKLVVKLENGETEITDIVADGFWGKGFVGVSTSDRRYFAYSNGESYFPIGINLCFPTDCVASNGSEFGLSSSVGYMGLRQYERWFRQCAENGVNMVRLWLGHDYFCPDTRSAGELDYEQLAKIDMVVSLAKKYGVKLKLTLEQFRHFSQGYTGRDRIYSLFDKTLCLDGEYCATVEEWMSEEKWQKAWLKKAEVLSAMFSCDTEIFAVELWNEMYFGTREWNEYMLTEVKKLFPNTMVVNSLGSLDSDSNMKNYMDFPWEKSDFKQLHRYLDQGGKYPDTTLDPIDVIKYGLSRIEDKTRPVIVAETGAVDNCHSGPFKYYPCDHRGIIFTDLVYSPLFFGAASCGNIWHWDGRYVEAKGLYRYFKPLSELVCGVEFDKEGFVSSDLSDDRATVLVLSGTETALVFCRNKSDSWYNTLRDLKEPVPIDSMEIKISGKNVRTIPIWQEDVPRISASEDAIKIENLRYGVLIRIDNL